MADLHQLRDKFVALSKREQYILFALAFVAVFFIWDQVFYAPLERENKRTQQKINSLQSKIGEIGKDSVALIELAKESPNAALMRDKEQFQSELADLDASIAGLTEDLIPPQKMASVLERVLRQETQLDLIKVTNFPAVELTTDSLQNVAVNQDYPTLYRHDVELQLEGGYFDTLNYLRALESLPWRVLWNGLDYKVDSFPNAVIVLRLSTLSTQAGWIGV